ncbi:MAG TPA: FmdB family zinc ribbon protein [Bacteroidota bacterium]|nr:FmdB family zinc ribbon protein [Bacteroidota bacterium]
MPVFDYQCEKCRTKYDVYHKGKELEEDVVCPSCGSKAHKKLMSIPAAPVVSGNAENSPGPACENGSCGCDGGCCNLN